MTRAAERSRMAEWHALLDARHITHQSEATRSAAGPSLNPPVSGRCQGRLIALPNRVQRSKTFSPAAERVLEMVS